MNSTQEKALAHLTGKTELSQLPKGVLSSIADEAPYFAPARFLATADLKQLKDFPAWLTHAQKTNLYFTSSLWLQYQLDTLGTRTGAATATQPAISPSKPDSQANDAAQAVREAMSRPHPSQETTGDIDETGQYEPETETEMTEESDNKISGMLSSQLADFKKPLDEADVLDIDAGKEKLHTVDYFASQGIKIDLNSMPQDKLTTHLLKFTDWLKQIKNTNLNPQKDLGTDVELEKAVVETAKNSNEIREIVTESMANVLEQQGQTEKAIQLYIKLSFLNPEKSSYFAAKIEQLKGII